MFCYLQLDMLCKMIYNKRVWQKLYAVSPLNSEDEYQH